MSGCLPKPYALGWHVPNFVNGSTPCVLQTFNETKARLVAGGALFRSVDVGYATNNITVECTIVCRDTNGVVACSTVANSDHYEDVTLIVNGTSVYGPYTQRFTPGDPLVPTQDSWSGDVIAKFRTALAADPNTAVSIPMSDLVIAPPISDHMTPFAVAHLKSGSGGPSNPSAGSSAIVDVLYLKLFGRFTDPNPLNWTPDSIVFQGDVSGIFPSKSILDIRGSMTNCGTYDGVYSVHAAGPIYDIALNETSVPVADRLNSNRAIELLPTYLGSPATYGSPWFGSPLPVYEGSPIYYGSPILVVINAGSIYSSALRTGPMYSLIHINKSEKYNEVGSMSTVNETRYYNGACWKSFDPAADPCNYTNLGSPRSDCP